MNESSNFSFFYTCGNLVEAFNLSQIYRQTEKAIYWDGKTETGKLVGSGTYVYQLQARLKSPAGDYRETRKMVILK